MRTCGERSPQSYEPNMGMHILVAGTVATREEPEGSDSTLVRISAMRRRTLQWDGASSGVGFSSGLTCR